MLACVFIEVVGLETRTRERTVSSPTVLKRTNWLLNRDPSDASGSHDALALVLDVHEPVSMWWVESAAGFFNRLLAPWVPFVHERGEGVTLFVSQAHAERAIRIEARESEQEFLEGAIASLGIARAARKAQLGVAPPSGVLERLGTGRFGDNQQGDDASSDPSGQHRCRGRDRTP